jgi:predicted nucleotidyltransferase
MRLTNAEIYSIKSIFKSVFKSGKVYLFGSRTNDKPKRRGY